MSYGLDMSDCRFTTDYDGNRLRADIPYPMFSALVEFWKAARRAQTQQIEQRAKPGTFKTSLADHTPSGTEEPPPDMPPVNPRHSAKRQQVEALFIVPAVPGTSTEPPAIASKIQAAITEANAAIDTAKRGCRKAQVYFPREFVKAPPDEILHAISNRTYFLKAWREYRQYSVIDVADLAGVSRDTVRWHEHGYNVPTDDTLKRYAEIYDCDIDMFRPKKKSNTKPFGEKRKSPEQAYAPDDTEYPDAVLAHLMAGKTPVTAWRLYRRLTIKQLAEQYGSTSQNIEQMEHKESLRESTREKLAQVLNCKPVQLLKPHGLHVERQTVAA